MLQRTSLVAQMVKCLPTMRDTQVQSLGWEDLLEKERATHSSILAWRIPGTEEPGRLQTMGSQRVGHDWACKELVMLQNGVTHLRKQKKYESRTFICSDLLLNVRTTGKCLATYTEIRTIASINLFWRIYWKMNFRLLRWLERHWQECWWWVLNM